MKPLKPILFSENPTSRPSALVPQIRSISWSPTASLLATCTSANIRIWSPERNKVNQSTEIRSAHNGSFGGGPGGSAAQVEKVAFCPTTENFLASTGHDGGLRLWDVRLPTAAAGVGRGTQLADCRTGETGLFLTWHPNGMEVLVGTKDDHVYRSDIRYMNSLDKTVPAEECTPATDSSSPTPRYYSMAFSNSGKELFATTGSGEIKIFDYGTMALLHELRGHSTTTYSVQHSPRGEWLAVGGADSIITLWDTTEWYCTQSLTAHASAVRELSFSFDGAYIIAGSGADARDGQAGIEVRQAFVL